MRITRNLLPASAAREDTRPPPPATSLEGERPREPRRLVFCLVQRLSPNCRLAFTLIEMLIVISIISVLLGLLYGAIERAQKFSRRTIAFTELKSIESAWKQYYAYYHAWPGNSNGLVNAASQLQSGEDSGFIIDEPIARMLQGVRDTATDVWKLNSESVPFIEFSRFSATTRAPVNPFKSVSSDPQDTTRSYKVLFDTNGDRQLLIPADPMAPGTTAPTNIIASVAVWTVIPATRQTTTSGQAKEATEVMFGSWDSFNVK